jgi:hypothetical protein
MARWVVDRAAARHVHVEDVLAPRNKLARARESLPMLDSIGEPGAEPVGESSANEP